MSNIAAMKSEGAGSGDEQLLAASVKE